MTASSLTEAWEQRAEEQALAPKAPPHVQARRDFWAILRDRDSALTRHVRSEIGRIDASVELHAANMARVFALEGHSGGSAPIMIAWLERALSWKPIAPLTGEADEWVDVAEQMGCTLWQNKRFFDYEHGDSVWLEEDEPCKRCHGDGMDPWCDYALPCPDCGGEA